MKLPADAPRGFRAPLGRTLAGLQEYAGRPCLDVRNDKGNPASDPCDVFCGLGDLKSWNRLAVKLIRNARAGCHRVGKCHRVELLAKQYDDNTSTIGAIKFLTTENLIREGIAPITQELACIVTDAAKAGPHPKDPRPPPAPPPTGPGPSFLPAWPGAEWLLPAGLLLALFLFSQR